MIVSRVFKSASLMLILLAEMFEISSLSTYSTECRSMLLILVSSAIMAAY